MTTAWCPGEGAFIPLAEVETFGTTRVHTAPPWHRLIDGAVIEMDGDGPRLEGGEPVVHFDEPEVAEEEE